MRALFAQILAGLAAVLLLLGIVNPDHFQLWTSYHSEVPAFAAGCLLLAAAALRGAAPLTPPIVVLCAMVVSVWAQWAFGLVPYAGDAWVVTSYVLVFAAAWLWAAADRESWPSQSPIELVTGALIVMGLLALMQVFLQWVQAEQAYPGWISESLEPRRSAGNFGQPNQTATLLLMSTAAVAAWAVRGRIGRVGLWAWLLTVAWGIVLTQSRTALLGATVSVMLLGAMAIRRPPLRPWAVQGVAWLACLFAFTWILQTVTFEFARQSLGMEAMRSAGLRKILWAQMLSALSHHPLAGFGWLQVPAAQQLGALAVPGIEQANYTHNLELDLAVMLGVPLAMLLIGLTVVWGARRLRRLAVEGDAIGISAVFILLPFLVHTQLELPHAYSYFLVPAGILCGVIDARTRTAGDRLRRLPAIAAGFAAASFAALLVALALDYARVEQDFRVNRFANRNIGSVPPGYVPPSLAMLTQFNDLLEAMRIRAGRDMPRREVEVLERAARRFTWAPLHYRAALADALNGRPENARVHLQVISHLFPPEVVVEARETWTDLAREKYPELRFVALP